MIAQKLNLSIVRATEELRAAEQFLKTTMEEVQAICPHTIVEQNPSSGSGKNWRVCLHCRLSEEGSHWSYKHTNWTRADYADPILGNHPERLVIQYQYSEDYWKRLLKFPPNIGE